MPSRDEPGRTGQQGSRERRRERLWWSAIAAMFVTAAVLLLVVRPSVGGGDGSAPLLEPVGDERSAPAAARAERTRRMPPQIAAHLRDANRIVDGDVEERIAALEGVPVVVNMWASWCPSCRAEFGFFQRLAEKYERRVAFLGLDSQDDRAAAQAFLEQFPVNYPSVFDPTAEQARRIGAGRSWPTTVFYDHTGRQTFVRQGGYTTEGSLEADLRRHALGP